MEVDMASLSAVLTVLFLLLWSNQGLTHTNTCIPKNWTYSWSKLGDVWFTRTHKKGNWQQVAEECQKVEPGLTSLASIRSLSEQKHVSIDLPNEPWWIGGAKIGTKKWMWITETTQTTNVTPITWAYWSHGEPSSPATEYCLQIFNKGPPRSWNDLSCFRQFKGICELRC